MEGGWKGGGEWVAAMGQGETVGSGKLTMRRSQAKSSLCMLHKVDDKKEFTVFAFSKRFIFHQNVRETFLERMF